METSASSQQNNPERRITISLFEGKNKKNVVQVSAEKNVKFEELIEYITKQSYSHIKFKGGYRKQANFEKAGCLPLDFDGGLSLDSAIVRIKEKNLKAIVGTTKSHQKEKATAGGKRILTTDRYRAIILLTREVENETDHRATFEALRDVFPECDPAPKDGARYFFPCTEVVFTNFEGNSFAPVSAPAIRPNQKNQPESSAISGEDRLNVLQGIDPGAARSRALAFLESRAPAIEGQGGDGHTLQTAMRLMDLGIETPEECCTLLEESKWNGKCQPPWPKEELLQKCRNALRSRKNHIGVDAPEAARKEKWDKPTIIIEKNRLHDLVVEAENVLIAAKVGLYARGPFLVEPVVEEVDASNGRKTIVTRLKAATLPLVRLILSKIANWKKWDSRSKHYIDADPPREIAEGILTRDGRWGFRKLAGVINCPTLRPDGSLLTKPGYDAETRLLLVGAPEMPEISAKPTRDDAIKALAILNELLNEFPYASEASRSVALSMLITPVVRGALAAAPLHAVRATAAGSGKSFLTDLASCIVSGQACPVIASGRDETETEKRLGAVIMTGQPIISLDNVNGELGGDALCQLIERPIVLIRPLGRSETFRVENKATVFATGNGIILTGDMTRRVVLCSLDANLERPELRQFKRNPLELVLENRGRYIAAALTVVRAYIEAGHPNPCPTLASFGDWSRHVRSALVWLGKRDPVDTMRDAREEDPQTAHFAQVVAAWSELPILSAPHTAGEIVKELNSGHTEERHQILKEALIPVSATRDGKEIDPARLGKWLSKNNGKISFDRKLLGVLDKHTCSKKWHLVQLPGLPRINGETDA